MQFNGQTFQHLEWQSLISDMPINFTHLFIGFSFGLVWCYFAIAIAIISNLGNKSTKSKVLGLVGLSLVLACLPVLAWCEPWK